MMTLCGLLCLLTITTLSWATTSSKIFEACPRKNSVAVLFSGATPLLFFRFATRSPLFQRKYTNMSITKVITLVYNIIFNIVVTFCGISHYNNCHAEVESEHQPCRCQWAWYPRRPYHPTKGWRAEVVVKSDCRTAWRVHMRLDWSGRCTGSVCRGWFAWQVHNFIHCQQQGSFKNPNSGHYDREKTHNAGSAVTCFNKVMTKWYYYSWQN